MDPLTTCLAQQYTFAEFQNHLHRHPDRWLENAAYQRLMTTALHRDFGIADIDVAALSPDERFALVPTEVADTPPDFRLVAAILRIQAHRGRIQLTRTALAAKREALLAFYARLGLVAYHVVLLGDVQRICTEARVGM